MFLTLIVILVQAKIFNIGQYFLQPHMHNSEYILKTIPMIIKALFPLYIFGKIIERFTNKHNS